MNKPIRIVSTLIGEGQVELGLECLGSLQRYSRDPVAFQIHEDGTLTDRSRARLTDALAIHRFIGRLEADRWAADALRRFPACLKFREGKVHGLKLFDVGHFHPADSVAYCDSDVFFLRPFQGLFDFEEPSTQWMFMKDCQDAYAVRPWHLAGANALRLISRLNSGLLLFNRAAMDTSVFERVISRGDPRYDRLPGWLEQTCWAALARPDNTRFWHHNDVLIPSTPADLAAGPVAAHLTSSVRGLLGAARAAQSPKAATPVRLRTEPARRLSVTGYVGSEIRRIFRNRVRSTP